MRIWINIFKNIGMYCMGLLILSAFTSCATRPKIWKDELGILHREDVSANEITRVRLLEDYGDLPLPCKRLRNVYLKGWVGKGWTLKEEGAKQFATHIVKDWYNGREDVMGVPYDCSNNRAVASRRAAQKLWLKNQAMGELERRTYERKQHKVVEDAIPTLQYNGNK
jgi:hypothetical protein